VTLLWVASLSGRCTKQTSTVSAAHQIAHFPFVLDLDQIGRLIRPDTQAALGLRSFCYGFLHVIPSSLLRSICMRAVAYISFCLAVSVIHWGALYGFSHQGL
jgi:hypothetical protein